MIITNKPKNKLPIVFIHGFLGFAEEFSPICALLKDFLCYPAVLPGHANQPFSMQFSDWIPPFDRMHLVGYSMGGRLCLQFAQKYPEKVASLICLSTHSGLHTENEKMKRKAIDQLWAEQILNSYDEFLIQWYKQPIFGDYRPDIEKRKLHNPQELAKALTYYSLANQEFIDNPKALFVVGEKDIKFRQLHKQATIIKNASHMIHLENTLDVAMTIQHHILTQKYS